MKREMYPKDVIFLINITNSIKIYNLFKMEHKYGYNKSNRG